MPEIWRLGGDDASYAAALDAARRALLSGEIALLPAEGLYGLHAAGFAAGAPARLRAAKGGPDARPFILLVATLEHALELVRELPGPAASLMREAWPGPLTLLLPASPLVPAELRPAGEVALRCPGTRLLRELALSLPGPILSTSANLAGAPPAAAFEEVEAAVLAACAVAVDGGRLSGIGSTLARPERDGSLRVIRQGLWRPAE
jgi:L-threonylcarbamoyladenylate synthase